jgi:hypothetical protein
MTPDLVVVEEAIAEDKVRDMARRRYSDLPREVLESDHFEVRTDSAQWCNHIQPAIRCAAGYRDHGRGTWTVNGPIALVLDGEEGDSPAAAESSSARDFAEWLFRVYHDTAHRQYERQRNDYLADQKETEA